MIATIPVLVRVKKLVQEIANALVINVAVMPVAVHVGTLVSLRVVVVVAMDVWIFVLRVAQEDVAHRVTGVALIQLHLQKTIQ